MFQCLCEFGLIVQEVEKLFGKCVAQTEDLYLFGGEDADCASIFSHGNTHLSQQCLSTELIRVGVNPRNQMEIYNNAISFYFIKLTVYPCNA